MEPTYKTYPKEIKMEISPPTIEEISSLKTIMKAGKDPAGWERWGEVAPKLEMYYPEFLDAMKRVYIASRTLQAVLNSLEGVEEIK
jgi:hypothetical protein